MQYLNIIIMAAGVVVALFIGGMQVYIASQQKRISDQQAKVSSIQGEMQVVSSWLPFLKDDDPNIRYMAVIALERLSKQSTVAPLVMALSDHEKNVRERAATALSNSVTDEVVEIIVNILDNQNADTRNAAINTLVKIGYQNIHKITEAIESASPTARIYGRKVIEKILLNEYALKKINAFESRKRIKGNPEILVAIIGTGVDKLIPDIQNALLDEYNHIDDSGKPGMSTTMVARFIIGAEDSEISGVAPGVTLVSERVLGESGRGSNETVVKGIQHATQIGVNIIYIELGSKADNIELQQAINNAHKAGCIIIAAAGNLDSNQKYFPAAMENVIAVAATTPDDRKADYSSYGNWVDISAPGNPIATDQGSDINSVRGTSFSGSLVAGAAALIWSADPSLANIEVEELLLQSADDIDGLNPAFKGKLGKGRLNILKAVELLQMRKVKRASLEHLNY